LVNMTIILVEGGTGADRVFGKDTTSVFTRGPNELQSQADDIIGFMRALRECNGTLVDLWGE
jgi:hypothetical protein